MSWNGTVTCGYCYDQGHNRRSCPELKKTLARRLAEDPDDRYAKYELEKQNKGKVRRCTYCNLKGHNRRTCEELNAAKQEWREKAAAWRLKFINWCVDNGVGPGTLVTKNDGWNAEEKLFVVKRPEWTTLNHDAQQKTSYPAYALQLIGMGLQPHTIQRTSLPKVEGLCGDDNSTYHSERSLAIKSPVKMTEEMFVKMAPQWWLDGKGSAEKNDLRQRFADRQSPNHYENQWEN